MFANENPRVRNRAKKPVIYVVGPSIAYLPLTKGHYSLIDSSDGELVGMRNWHVQRNYAVTTVHFTDGTQNVVRLHNLLLDTGGRDLPDHKNGNGLDNRRSNLRPASYTQNNQNKRVAKNNTTGFKGVRWDTKMGKFRAQIGHQNKKIHLGFFESAERANDAYCAAAINMFGDFARISKEAANNGE